MFFFLFFFFFQAEDGIRDLYVTGVQTCALPICLLWWPCAEYGRVVRQVPELRDVLGAPWRGHTARVESAMAAMAAEAARTSSGATQRSLAAAQYERFAGFLERTGADPRLAVVMTAFTEQAEASAATANVCLVGENLVETGRHAERLCR